MSTIEQLETYIKELLHHDWFYDYSDDHSVWRAGKANQTRLAVLADTSPSFKLAYDSVSKYMWTDVSKRDFIAMDSQLNQARAMEKS